jgi:hypothetical protein
MTTKTSWVIKIEEDPATGDGILTFPPDLLECAGWKEGDVLTWADRGDGSWQLTKKEEDTMLTALSEFTSEEFNRTAIVYKKDGNYGTIMYRGTECVEDRICVGNTMQYAEDLAENWVNRWGEFKV